MDIFETDYRYSDFNTCGNIHAQTPGQDHDIRRRTEHSEAGNGYLVDLDIWTERVNRDETD
jgi:hypothetical protein